MGQGAVRPLGWLARLSWRQRHWTVPAEPQKNSERNFLGFGAARAPGAIPVSACGPRLRYDKMS